MVNLPALHLDPINHSDTDKLRDTGFMPHEQELLDQLYAQREKLFASHDCGKLTTTDVSIGFVELMLQTHDDEQALALCVATPDWFQIAFSDRLSKLSELTYKAKWFSAGDIRTLEQIENDAKRHQAILQRLAPRIQAFYS